MGMSTHVIGFCEPTEEYKRKADAWRACKAAGVEPPHELMRLFDGNEPDDEGQEVDLNAQPWRVRSSEGVQIRVADIPAGVTVIRFYNSW